MREASRIVLRDFELRTDATLVNTTNFRKLAGPSGLSRVRLDVGHMDRSVLWLDISGRAHRVFVRPSKAGRGDQSVTCGGADNSRPFTTVRDRLCRIFAVRS